jgi:hypothetical protein
MQEYLILEILHTLFVNFFLFVSQAYIKRAFLLCNLVSLGFRDVFVVTKFIDCL